MPRDLTNGMSVRSKKRDDRFANQDTLVTLLGTNPFSLPGYGSAAVAKLSSSFASAF